MVNFEITDNGFLINLHCVLWSSDEQAFSDIENLSVQPKFSVRIGDKETSLDSFILKMVGDIGHRYTLLLGRNFINTYQSEDLPFWLEVEQKSGNDKNLFDLVMTGGTEKIDHFRDEDSGLYYAEVLYPIMLSFENKACRDKVIESNEYIRWMTSNLLGNALFTYLNPPSDIDSFAVGLSSNDQTVENLEGLAVFASKIKGLFHDNKQVIHDRGKFIVGRKDDHYFLPYISLMSYSKAMFHLEMDQIMHSFMIYLRNFFFLVDTIELMCNKVVVVRGSVDWLMNGMSDEDINNINVSHALPNVIEEICEGYKPDLAPEMESRLHSKQQVLTHPRVGRFGLLSTWYSEDRAPLWKTLYYPTNRQGYIELAALTEKIESLIASGSNRHSIEKLDLLRQVPASLSVLLKDETKAIS